MNHRGRGRLRGTKARGLARAKPLIDAKIWPLPKRVCEIVARELSHRGRNLMGSKTNANWISDTFPKKEKGVVSITGCVNFAEMHRPTQATSSTALTPCLNLLALCFRSLIMFRGK